MKIQVYILLINLLFLTEVFGQSLKLDDAFELINSTPSKMTVKLANNNWKFFDAIFILLLLTKWLNQIIK